MSTPVLMPKLGNSVESCLIVAWHKKVGDVVQTDEGLCEIETDKATFLVQSPASGILLELFFADGDEVPVLTPIAMIGEIGAVYSRPSSSEKPVGTFLSQPLQTFAKTSGNPRDPTQFISPRARNLAAEHQLEISAVLGTGPNGRIIERDVKTMLEKQVITPSSSPLPALPEGTTAIALKGVRKRIADRMLESLQSTAQLTLNTSADAQALQALRQRLKALTELDSSLPSITLNHLILLVVARTLKTYSNINATFEHDVMYQHESVHLGFAVDSERGLLVPVIRHAHRLGLRELSQQATRLARDCQAGSIAPDDLQGGTFTISNLGGFGIETFTPILNPPQIAILGIGSINLKAVQEGENVVFLPHLNLSLTINHQVLDGAPAARFLQGLCHNFAHISDLMLF